MKSLTSRLGGEKDTESRTGRRGEGVDRIPLGGGGWKSVGKRRTYEGPWGLVQGGSGHPPF